MQLPLVDSLLALEDLIQDTTQVRVEPGTGNLALALEGELTPIVLAQELGRVGELRLERSFRLNDITGLHQRFQEWQDPVQAIPLKALYSQLPDPPAEQVIPPLSTPVQIDSVVRLPEGLYAVAYRQGTLQIVLENRYPVPVEIAPLPGYGQSGILLQTPGYGEWFVPLTALQSTIPPGERRGEENSPGGVIRAPLAGVVVTRQTRIQCALTSPGSGGQQVTYTDASLFRVFLQPRDVEVEWAHILPAGWNAEILVELPLPNGAEISSAEIAAFSAQLELDNGFPFGADGIWRFGQLRSRTGEPVSRSLAIPASAEVYQRVSEQGPIVLVPEPEDAGSIRALRIRLQLQIQQPSDIVTVRAEQGVVLRVVVDTLLLRTARGTRLPVGSFETQAQSEVWLQGNLGLLSQVEVELAELIIEAVLENSAAVGFRVEGTVEVADRNGTVMARLPVTPQFVAPAVEQGGTVTAQQTRWELRYSDVGLTNRPRFVRFLWTVTPEASGTWAFADTSQIRGRVQVLIPVRVRVQQLSYEQQWAFTGGDMLRRQGQRIERAEVIVETRNRFPVTLQFFLVFADTLDSVRVPLEGVVSIPAAPVTLSGVAETEGHGLQRIVLDSWQIPLLLRADRLRLELRAQTTAQQYVRIRTSDYVHLRAMLRAELAVP
jgi:hypothetical protein